MPQMQKHRNVTSRNDLESQLEFCGIGNHELSEKFIQRFLGSQSFNPALTSCPGLKLDDFGGGVPVHPV